MNKEYLIDYEKRELEEHEKYKKMLINGKFDVNNIFPPENRFVKLSRPIAWSMTAEDFWPQIPISGSTIQMLFPIKKEFFKKTHGYESSDIDRIIDFIKETGKIQYVIDWPPTAFEGLDFLEPVFSELKPPTYPIAIEDFFSVDEKEVNEIEIEFDTFSEINFHRFIWDIFSHESSKPELLVGKRMHDFKIDYIILKLLGKEDIIENLIDLIISDPPEAYKMFIILGSFITVPLIDPLRGSFNYPMDLIEKAVQYKKVEQPTFPCEIGKFLMKKIIHYPDSLTACQEIIAHYQDYDLQKVVTALNNGIKTTNFYLVNETKEKLSDILELIWTDKSIANKIKGITYGVPLSLAVLGAISFGPIGAIGGLLGGLGFSVGSQFLQIKTDDLSERIAKRLSTSYQVNIYNFKEKYKLN